MSKIVLLVDKDQEFLNKVSKKLTGDGYSVVLAKNEEDAIKELKSIKPDIMISEIIFDRPDGGLALAYHAKKINPKLIIVLISDLENRCGIRLDVMQTEQKKWIHADAILSKPVRYEQIISTLARLETVTK